MEKRKIQIKIPDPSEVFNSAYRPIIEEAPETKEFLIIAEGGRASGKSRGIIGQGCTLRALRRKTRFALIRKVAETIRDSSYREIEDQVKEWELEAHFRFLTSPLSIKVANGSEFVTRGLDKPEKIKSLANVDVAIIEEATELTKADWEVLRFTFRGKNVQVILLFNRTAGNWTEKEFFKADGTPKKLPNTYHLHTTFLDNKFLSERDVENFNRLKQEDPEAYKKIAEGMPVKLKGLIYSFQSVDVFPDNCSEIIYGLDFGYSPDPTVLLKIGRRGMELFLQQSVYDYKLTNADLIKRMRELRLPTNSDIYPDIAEPDRIEEIYRAGFNIHDKETTTKDVDFGIDVMRRFTINIVSGSAETEKDFGNYRWKVDKNGEPVSPATPGHAGSHAPDGARYAVASHWGQEFKRLQASDVTDVEVEELESISKFAGY